MPLRSRTAFAALIMIVGIDAAAGAPACGESAAGFPAWLKEFKAEAAGAGISSDALAALDGVSYDQKVIGADRKQGVFAQSFLEFSGRMVADYRMSKGKSLLKYHAATFKKVEQEFGVPGAVIVGFWGLETDFGANLGSFNTLQALATLAYDCRRPEKFRPELIAALKILDRGDLTPAEMKGAWAGEIGQTQFVPSYYFDFAVDYDGDGKRNLVKSVPDVLASSANLLKHHGWQAGEPWLEEVQAPADLPWAEADLAIKHSRSDWAGWGVKGADGGALPADSMQASLLLPMGHLGPAFLAYANFDVYTSGTSRSSTRPPPPISPRASPALRRCTAAAPRRQAASRCRRRRRSLRRSATMSARPTA